jgi:deoxyribonuclease V
LIAAFDVHYIGDGSASAAAVLFTDYGDREPAAEFTQLLSGAAEYIPGEFYRRELPCILAVLQQIKGPLDEIIIDGYVMLANRAGLGMHLFNHLNGRVPVIGVAKSRFKDAYAAEVFRGRSERPLYITAAGMKLKKASEQIREMHGDYRIPTMLRVVDLLARGKMGE